MKEALILEEDALIQEVLDTSDVLKNYTESITTMFEEYNQNEFKNQFVTDICKVINDTLDETINRMEDKACEIEVLVSSLPTLTFMDDLAIDLCGKYCLETCELGLPIQIMQQSMLCLIDESRKNISDNTSSHYIEVNIISIHISSLLSLHSIYRVNNTSIFDSMSSMYFTYY